MMESVLFASTGKQKEHQQERRSCRQPLSAGITFKPPSSMPFNKNQSRQRSSCSPLPSTPSLAILVLLFSAFCLANIEFINAQQSDPISASGFSSSSASSGEPQVIVHQHRREHPDVVITTTVTTVEPRSFPTSTISPPTTSTAAVPTTSRSTTSLLTTSSENSSEKNNIFRGSGSSGGGDTSDGLYGNAVTGMPDIECGHGIVRFRVDTTKGKNVSSVFVRGQSQNPDCVFHNTREAQIDLSKCNIRRKREVHGVEYVMTVVVQMHPLFITKVDRAYRVNCFYMEKPQDVSSTFNVSDMATQAIQADHQVPNCTYSVHRDSPNGPMVKFTRVGEQLYHVWECPSRVYSMLLHSCHAVDGSNREFSIIDEHGCSKDEFLMPQITYTGERNKAIAASAAFNFPDRNTMLFQCKIKLCYNSDAECHQITPPMCNGRRETTSISSGRSGGGDELETNSIVGGSSGSSLTTGNIVSRGQKTTKPTDLNSSFGGSSTEDRIQSTSQRTTVSTSPAGTIGSSSAATTRAASGTTTAVPASIESSTTLSTTTSSQHHPRGGLFAPHQHSQAQQQPAQLSESIAAPPNSLEKQTNSQEGLAIERVKSSDPVDPRGQQKEPFPAPGPLPGTSSAGSTEWIVPLTSSNKANINDVESKTSKTAAIAGGNADFPADFPRPGVFAPLTADKNHAISSTEKRQRDSALQEDHDLQEQPKDAEVPRRDRLSSSGHNGPAEREEASSSPEATATGTKSADTSVSQEDDRYIARSTTEQPSTTPPLKLLKKANGQYKRDTTVKQQQLEKQARKRNGTSSALMNGGMQQEQQQGHQRNMDQQPSAMNSVDFDITSPELTIIDDYEPSTHRRQKEGQQLLSSSNGSGRGGGRDLLPGSGDEPTGVEQLLLRSSGGNDAASGGRAEEYRHHFDGDGDDSSASSFRRRADGDVCVSATALAIVGALFITLLIAVGVAAAKLARRVAAARFASASSCESFSTTSVCGITAAGHGIGHHGGAGSLYSMRS